MAREKILIGWTTVDTAKAAHCLAAALVASRLAACVQVDGPMSSHYIWQGKQKNTKEWRLWVKFPAGNAKKIAACLRANHPYSTPQWLAVAANVIAAPYGEWVWENTRQAAVQKKNSPT